MKMAFVFLKIFGETRKYVVRNRHDFIGFMSRLFIQTHYIAYVTLMISREKNIISL